jgi:hypothetical protein
MRTNVGLFKRILEMAGFMAILAVYAPAQAPKSPGLAPIEQYLMPRPAEIDMARSAAPKSISADAEILVLGRTGYEVAIKGKNGFVCLVQRGFAAAVDDPVFWNAKIRGPACLNAEAARTFLPHITRKAEWVLAGLSTEQLTERITAAIAGKEFPALAPGAMCYMMAKDQYLNNDGAHWHPHLMFYVPGVDAKAWGADLPGSPLFASTDKIEGYTVYMIPVGKWSDGTPGPEI